MKLYGKLFTDTKMRGVLCLQFFLWVLVFVTSLWPNINLGAEDRPHMVAQSSLAPVVLGNLSSNLFPYRKQDCPDSNLSCLASLNIGPVPPRISDQYREKLKTSGLNILQNNPDESSYYTVGMVITVLPGALSPTLSSSPKDGLAKCRVEGMFGGTAPMAGSRIFTVTKELPREIAPPIESIASWSASQRVAIVSSCLSATVGLVSSRLKKIHLP